MKKTAKFLKLMTTSQWPIVFSVFLISLPASLHAQEKNNYWQQEVNYVINVKLDDAANFLHGNISIEYINHSPDTLHYIWFHLWPNAYRNTETAFAKQLLRNQNTDFYYSDEKDKGYIDSLSFKINDRAASLQYDGENIDEAKLLLNEPLPPGQKIAIFTPFRVKIPRTFSRFGHIGQSYQVTQWYPKPAVYDRFGWHQMPYLHQGEFYSEFGSYDVTITLPKNYVVGATGNLQNPEEESWLDSLASIAQNKFVNTQEASSSFLVVRKNDESKSTFPSSSLQQKSIRFIAENVHDFAWFADKRYNVMRDSVMVGNHHKVMTWTMFIDDAASYWKNAIHYVDSSVYYISKWVGDYPYSHATAVQGSLEAGDGMEYPMITVISGDLSGRKTLEDVIAHEVCHNWFYGALGFNEREHPWMDEGITTYYENRYIETRYPNDRLWPPTRGGAKTLDITQYPQNYQYYLTYMLQAWRHLDQPMDMNAADLTSLNYGAIVYAKTEEVWRYLAAYLGQSEYDQVMQGFYKEWKFRHPSPIDLRQFFEAKTGKNLDWLFREIIPTTNYIDYKLVRQKEAVVVDNVEYQKLLISNKAQVAGPFSINAIQNGKLVEEKWYEGISGRNEVLFPKGNYEALRIDANMDIPEVNRKNNTIRTSGIFRNIEKLRLQFLASLDNPQRTQIFYAPVAGWNNYDKFWLGLATYNSPLQNKPVSLLLMPSYGFGSNKFVGLGQGNLQLFPGGRFIQSIDITSSVRSFDYANAYWFGAAGGDVFRFLKLTQQVKLRLKNNHAGNHVEENILYRNIYLKEDFPVELNELELTAPIKKIFNQLSFSIRNRRIINPFDLTITCETGNLQPKNFFIKGYLQGNYTITYPRKRFGVDLRLFAGLMSRDNILSTENFHLSATSGAEDYRFDQLYFGRVQTDGFLARQIAIADDGGFKIRTAGVYPVQGASTSWIIAMNVKVSTPFYRRLFIFGDAGFVPATFAYKNFQFDAGIGTRLIPNILEVYLPLFFSEDIRRNLNSTEFYDKWYKRILFTFRIELLNPFELIKQAGEGQD